MRGPGWAAGIGEIMIIESRLAINASLAAALAAGPPWRAAGPAAAGPAGPHVLSRVPGGESACGVFVI